MRAGGRLVSKVMIGRPLAAIQRYALTGEWISAHRSDSLTFILPQNCLLGLEVVWEVETVPHPQDADGVVEVEGPLDI